MSSVIGGPSEIGLASTTRPYRKAPMTTSMPLARYNTINGALASGSKPAENTA
ncbi:hypothetical protein [Mesorhizobium sp. BHbdii]